MPADTPDQQITLPIGVDSADNPVAFTNQVADIESRLVRRYVDVADRTARMLVLNEGDISSLANENRLDAYDGANHISLFSRSLFSQTRVTPSQTLTQNTTALQNITALLAPVPIAGNFGFRATMFYSSSTVADIKFAFLLPAGGSVIWGGIGLVTAGSGTGDASFITASASDAAIPFGGSGAGVLMYATIEGSYVAGGTAGNLQMRAAQNTAELTNTVVSINSRLQVWRIA